MHGRHMGYRACSTGDRGSSTRLMPAGNGVAGGRLPELAGFQPPYRGWRTGSREPVTNTSRRRNQFTAGALLVIASRVLVICRVPGEPARVAGTLPARGHEKAGAS